MKAFFSIIVLFIFTFNAVSQNRNELEKKKANTLKEIAETESILNSVKQNKSESMEMLGLLDKKIVLRNNLISNLSSEITDVDKKIVELEKITESLGSDIKNIKSEYAKMIYLAYLNRQPYNQFMFILSSSDINQAYKRVLYLKQYSEYHHKQIVVINGVQNSLATQIKELESKRKEKYILKTSQEKENRNLKTEMDEKTKLVNSLKQKENVLTKKFKEQNRIAEKLQKEIENIIKAELKAKAHAAEKNSKHVVQKEIVLSNNFRENKGKLPWPADGGVITRGFGEYQHPIYKDVKCQSLGIEITTNSGSNVHAIFDGEVASILYNLGTNYMILITHGNFFTVYQNVVDVKVKKGDKVKINQVIGKIFTDVSSKTSVLRVQIWEEKKNLDPEVWIHRN
jgi:murein hydrolase activator